MESNYYDLLQVSPDADPGVIDSAYRSLVAKYEPQAATNPDAAGQLQRINEAYRVLSDPGRRAQYDQALRGGMPLPGAMPMRSETTTSTRTGSTVPPVLTIPPPPPTRRSGLPIWLIALLGVCLVGALAVVCAGGALAVGGSSALSALLNSATRTPLPTIAPPPTEVPPTLVPTAASTVAPAQPTPGASGTVSFITKVVMTTATTGGNFDPVGETSTFTPDATFHAVVTIENAPQNTAVKAVWYAEEVGSAAAPNTKIDEFTLTTSGSRNLDFTLKPKSTWVAGTYRVEIYGNGTLAQTVKFSVAPGTGGNTPTSVIKSTTFARDVTPDVFDPVDPTTTFSPSDQVLHLVVAIENAPDNSVFKASWFFGQQAIDSTTLNAGGTRNLDFRLRQNKPWPTGDYSVQLFVNGNLDRTVNFSVQ